MHPSEERTTFCQGKKNKKQALCHVSNATIQCQKTSVNVVAITLAYPVFKSNGH